MAKRTQGGLYVPDYVQTQKRPEPVETRNERKQEEKLAKAACLSNGKRIDEMSPTQILSILFGLKPMENPTLDQQLCLIAVVCDTVSEMINNYIVVLREAEIMRRMRERYGVDLYSRGYTFGHLLQVLNKEDQTEMQRVRDIATELASDADQLMTEQLIDGLMNFFPVMNVVNMTGEGSSQTGAEKGADHDVRKD